MQYFAIYLLTNISTHIYFLLLHILLSLFVKYGFVGDPTCTYDDALWRNNTYPRCPTDVGRYVVPIMMGIYMLLANVLLLNLLIAMFRYGTLYSFGLTGSIPGSSILLDETLSCDLCPYMTFAVGGTLNSNKCNSFLISGDFCCPLMFADILCKQFGHSSGPTECRC